MSKIFYWYWNDTCTDGEYRELTDEQVLQVADTIRLRAHPTESVGRVAMLEAAVAELQARAEEVVARREQRNQDEPEHYCINSHIAAIERRLDELEHPQMPQMPPPVSAAPAHIVGGDIGITFGNDNHIGVAGGTFQPVPITSIFAPDITSRAKLVDILNALDSHKITKREAVEGIEQIYAKPASAPQPTSQNLHRPGTWHPGLCPACGKPELITGGG